MMKAEAVVMRRGEEDCQECREKESLRQRNPRLSAAATISAPRMPEGSPQEEQSSCSSSSSKGHLSWSRGGDGGDRRRKGGWSSSTLLVFTAALLVLITTFSQVSAKGDVMPEDDFDSSNKKVKFEDFDTVSFFFFILLFCKLFMIL